MQRAAPRLSPSRERFDLGMGWSDPLLLRHNDPAAASSPIRLWGVLTPCGPSPGVSQVFAGMVEDDPDDPHGIKRRRSTAGTVGERRWERLPLPLVSFVLCWRVAFSLFVAMWVVFPRLLWTPILTDGDWQEHE